MKFYQDYRYKYYPTYYKQTKITKYTNLPSSSISLVILSSSLMAEKSLRAEIAVPAPAPSCSTKTKPCYHLISKSDKDLFSPYNINTLSQTSPLSPNSQSHHLENQV